VSRWPAVGAWVGDCCRAGRPKGIRDLGAGVEVEAGQDLAEVELKVPYSVVYDLHDDHISALRIYFPMSLLIEQLTS